MTYIKKLSIVPIKIHPFPFDVPAVKLAQNIELDNKVTIFMGRNGSGKSTIMEALALFTKLPIINGAIDNNESFIAARALQPYMEVKLNQPVLNGFFFRAEDFSYYITSVQRAKQHIYGELEDLKGKVKNSVIEEIAEGMNYSLHKMRRQYGENLELLSHGEACMRILKTKIQSRGLYLLDEPELGLDPTTQLTLNSWLTEMADNNNIQFIITTHSPIIASMSNAALYEIQEDAIRKVEYKKSNHYRIFQNLFDEPPPCCSPT
jgi:predicted ATPase